jgi:hypothetical protein
MAKTIYILLHKEKGFTGFVHGVGFENGRGATSSTRDRNFLVNKMKFKDVTGPYWEEKREEKEAAKKKAEAEKKAGSGRKEDPKKPAEEGEGSAAGKG